MRSLSDQTVTELGGPLSVLTRQKRDHVKLDRLLDELAATRGAEQERVLHRIARLVFPHAFAEESVLWPELRLCLSDGEALTLQVEQEHQEVNELWTRLESGTLTAEERQGVIDRLIEVLRQDVRDEEDELLPRLQHRVSVGRLRRLGVAWVAVRRVAPSRPHPIVSRRPPGNVLAALPLTVVDHLRDAVDAGARRADGPAAQRLTGVSQALRSGGQRIERLPFLRAGEDPSTRRDPAGRSGEGEA